MACRLGRPTFASQTNGNRLELERALSKLPPAHPLPKAIPFCPGCQYLTNPHHTWLHFNMKANPQRQMNVSLTNTPTNVMYPTSKLCG